MIAVDAPEQDLILTLWLDPDDQVLDQAGIGLPQQAAAGDPAQLAATLYRDGVRRVAFGRPVDLTGDLSPRDVVRTMLLLQELTSWGIVTDWQLRPGNSEIWQRLNHLQPPTDILDESASAEMLTEWRETFYLCKCIYRRGPGFIEVRDRRSGVLARFVIDAEDYLAATERLIQGARTDQIPSHLLTELVDEGLVGIAGNLAWWLPYRVKRWPWPSMVV